MKIIKSKVESLDSLIEERLKEIDPKISEIPMLRKVKAFIDEAVLKEKRTLYVFTDYDVDGVTSTACAVKMFRYAYPDAHIIYRTPRRLSEGYGFSLKVLPEVPENSILVTIDNGIVAFDPIKAAKEKGCKVVVIDHHLGAEDGRLPEADLIVDPNAVEGQSEFSSYCGCGLTYKLSLEYDLPSETRKQILGLAALATIADCVPLVGENWLIARHLNDALSVPAIEVMAQAYQLESISEGDAGFKICPTLNAPGRLLDRGAQKAADFLLGEIDLLEELIRLNEERKALTEKYTEEAIQMMPSDMNAVSLLTDAPEGLVGIVAGRMAEQYQCPAFIFTKSKTPGVIKGSARTFGENNVKQMLDKCSDLLVGYGGHTAAAGLSLKEEMLPEFTKRINKLSVRDESDAIYYDIELPPYYVGEKIADTLMRLDKIRPFGQDNPEPIFFIKNVRLFPRGNALFKTMGSDNQHLKLFGKDFDILYFGKAPEYTDNPYERLDVVGKIGANRFLGKTSYQIEALLLQEAKREFKKTDFQSLLDKRAAIF